MQKNKYHQGEVVNSVYTYTHVAFGTQVGSTSQKFVSVIEKLDYCPDCNTCFKFAQTLPDHSSLTCWEYCQLCISCPLFIICAHEYCLVYILNRKSRRVELDFKLKNEELMKIRFLVNNYKCYQTNMIWKMSNIFENYNAPCKKHCFLKCVDKPNLEAIIQLYIVVIFKNNFHFYYINSVYYILETNM